MIKVKLDLKFLHWYLSVINEYFRIHILLSLDVCFCYTFNSHEKVVKKSIKGRTAEED